MKRKKYIRNINNVYVEEIVCNKCGAVMHHTGMILTSYPAQYPYKCSNSKCDGYIVLKEDECPNGLIYEFEEERDNV